MTDENRKHAYLEWLYDEHYHRLMLFCLVKIGREPDRIALAEECVQETFFLATKSIEQLAEHENVRGWLFETAENRLMNELNKRWRRAKWHAYSLDQEGMPEAVEPFDAIQAFVERDANRKGLKKLFAVLTQEQKEIVHERFSQQLSIREIAQKHGLPEGSVKSIIHRILKRGKGFFNLSLWLIKNIF